MRLRPVLDRLGLDQKAVAEELGVAEETVSRWGGRLPQGRHLVALLDYLQKHDPSITLDDLTGGEAA
jgi:DNA-binding transcriptional regulator YiaG